jgi:hypothetical protein
VSNLPEVRHHGGDTDTSERDDWLHFPIAWAETGQYGTLLVSPQAWRGLAYRYQAAGAPDGAPSTYTWWYSWSGHCFVPHSRLDPPQPPTPPSASGSFWINFAWAWIPAMFGGGLSGPDFVSGLAGAITVWLVCWAITHGIRLALASRHR